RPGAGTASALRARPNAPPPPRGRAPPARKGAHPTPQGKRAPPPPPPRPYRHPRPVGAAPPLRTACTARPSASQDHLSLTPATTATPTCRSSAPLRTACTARPSVLPLAGKTALLPQHRLNHRILQIPPSADNCRQLHSGGQPLGMDIHRHPTSSQGDVLRRYHFQERHLSGPVTVVRHPLVLLRQLQQRRLLFGLLAEDLQGRQHIFQLPQAVDHRLPIEGRLLFVPGHSQFQGSAALATVQQRLGQARAQ